MSRKLDAAAEAWMNGVPEEGDPPKAMVFKCASPDVLPDVVREIERWGGRVRHRMPAFGCVSAWVGRLALSVLAESPRITAIETVAVTQGARNPMTPNRLGEP